MDGDRIVGIADGFTAPAAGDTVVDLRTATLMPGLMDMHVHISSEQSGAAGYAERFFLNPADVALRATTYAKKTLMAGFTPCATAAPARSSTSRCATPSRRAGSLAPASSPPAA